MISDDQTENIERFVHAIKNVDGTTDTKGLSMTIQLYLKFMEAVYEYRSNYRYSGNTVLVKAKTKSPIMAAFQDENLGVGEVKL